MHFLFKLAPFVLVVVVSCGCQRGKVDSPSMMHQVLGALQVRGDKERDAALAAACRECADQGDGQSVLLGIPHIRDKKLRNGVAEECVSKLQSARKAEAAQDVAELITDPTQ